MRRWWLAWQQYSGFKVADDEDALPDVRDQISRPGPITNEVSPSQTMVAQPTVV